MLVLSLKEGERIVIGRSMVLTVVEISGKRVRLSFNGPPEVPIQREEVLRRWETPPEPADEEPAVVGSRYFAECP